MTCPVGCQFEPYYEHLQTNFTCPQLQTYCDATEYRDNTKWRIDTVVNAILALAGCGALISYIMMMLVFRMQCFNGVSYIYHKAIVTMEIVHMFVMAQSGIRRLCHFDTTTYSYVLYMDLLCELWIIGDGMKMSTSILTVFLSLERFIAICIPVGFFYINNPTFAWTCVAISLGFGMLHLAPGFTRDLIQTVDPVTNATIWTSVSKTGRQSGQVGGDEIISMAIYSAKIVSCVAMGVLCVGVSIGLILQSKKSDSLTMTKTAKSKWNEKLRLSVLQLIIASLQIFDHVMWVVDNVIKDRTPLPSLTGVDAIVELDFDRSMAVIKHLTFWRWFSMCSDLTGVFDHATRWPLYMIGVKTFRLGFWALCRKDFDAMDKLGIKTTGGTTRALGGGGRNSVAPMTELGVKTISVRALPIVAE